MAKVLPEEWRKYLTDRGCPKRKYTAVCRAVLVSDRVIEDLIIEEGWVIALSRAGLGGTFEERINFDPHTIVSLELKQVV
ncbi:MAG TPA: hypothetical protein VGB55_13585 [Tepidisphaeraceae bacterium]